MVYLFKGSQYLTKDVDYIVGLVSKILKILLLVKSRRYWKFYCWFSLRDIENFIVSLVSKIWKILLLV